MDGLRFDTMAKKVAGKDECGLRASVLSGLATRLRRRGLLRGGAAALAAVALAGGRVRQARAANSLAFCNYTAEEVWVAVSYNENKGTWCTDNWWTEGWWRLAACGGCATVYSGTPASSYFYYYAYSDTGSWDGEFFAYVSDSVFGVCEAQGSGLPSAHQVGFKEVNIGNSSRHTVNLRNPDNYDGAICIDYGTNLNPVDE